MTESRKRPIPKPVPARAILVRLSAAAAAEVDRQRRHLEGRGTLGGRVTATDVVRDALGEYLKRHRGRVEG
jgi:hypothetical protein